jgi:hypothetical protein
VWLSVSIVLNNRKRFFSENFTLELVESLHAIRNGSLEGGSIARLVDCCPLEYDPFKCIAELRGICHTADYPELTGQCVPNKCQPFFHVCVQWKRIFSFKNGHLVFDIGKKSVTLNFFLKKVHIFIRVK